MKKFDTVLITGGNGNLGRLVAERFEALGTKVVSFDLPNTEGPHTKARHAVVLGDIRDTAVLQTLLDTHKPQAIVHLASLLSGSSEANPELAWEVNATASIRLMRMAFDQGIGPFFFASTVASFGPEVPDNLPEDTPQWPQNIYGATKVAVERMGVYFKLKHGFDFRCLRFPMVLSPSSPPGAVTAYPGHALNHAAAHKPFTFPVSPQTGMSTLFLNDVTRSIVEYIHADAARLTRHAYNLHGFHFTTQQLAETIRTRFPNAQFDYETDTPAEALIANAPNSMECQAASDDWDWQIAYDYEKCMAAMFDMVKGDNG